MYHFVMIVLIIIFIHVRYQRIRYNYMYNHNKVSLCDVREGDVLALSCDYLYYHLNIGGYASLNVIQNLYSGQLLYTHYAIVIKINGVLYVCHMSSDVKFDEFRKKYVFCEQVVETLESFVIKYPGCVSLLKVDKEFKDQINDSAVDFYLNDGRKITYDLRRWSIDVLHGTNIFKDNTITCYEHIYTIIHNAFHGSGLDLSHAISSPELYNFLIIHGYTHAGIVHNFYYDYYKGSRPP